MTNKKQTKKIKKKTKSSASVKADKRHAFFVEEYLIDWNATRAYQAVYGCESNAAGASAARLLRDVRIQDALKVRVDERNKALKVDQTYVVNKLKEVVESDYCGTIKYLTQDEIDELPKDVRKLIQSIDITKAIHKDRDEDGEEIQTPYIEKLKVTFMNKDKALELLGKHTGAFIKDNVTTNINVKSFAEAMAELEI